MDLDVIKCVSESKNLQIQNSSASLGIALKSLWKEQPAPLLLNQPHSICLQSHHSSLSQQLHWAEPNSAALVACKANAGRQLRQQRHGDFWIWRLCWMLCCLAIMYGLPSRVFPNLSALTLYKSYSIPLVMLPIFVSLSSTTHQHLTKSDK